MFGYDVTINSVHRDFEKLIKAQRNVMNSFDAVLTKIVNESEACETDLAEAVHALVPVGNAKRYDEITEAAKEAGADFDCSALVHRWTAEDNSNRAEKERLEQAWGDIKTVSEKEAKERETLGIMKEAFGEVSLEVEEFDKTTAAIEAHNQKYVNCQITLESHDEYESTGFWRWLGYYTFINRGPHAAHLALGSYTDETGQDYFEYKAEIEEMRETQANLETDVATQEAKYNEVKTVYERMQYLDAAYRGPEGIAQEIRGIIADFLEKDDDFAVVLNDHMQSENAHRAALAVAKIRTFAEMTEDVRVQRNYAQSTLSNLQSPIDTLESAQYKVGGRSINFDMSTIEDAVNANARVMRGAVKKAEQAVQNVENYRPQEGPNFYEMRENLRSVGKLEFSGNALNLDFNGLERLVRNEVSEYEAEQEAKSLAEEAARELQRASMKPVFDKVSRTRVRRETGLTNAFDRPVRRTGISISSVPSPDRPSVSMGTRGRSVPNRSSVKMGRRGR